MPPTIETRMNDQLPKAANREREKDAAVEAPAGVLVGSVVAVPKVHHDVEVVPLLVIPSKYPKSPWIGMIQFLLLFFFQHKLHNLFLFYHQS